MVRNSGTMTYSLPNGCNPFEAANYYNNNDTKEKYFIKWMTLKDEWGNEDNNIAATSPKLPNWQFPSYGDEGDWSKILFGGPKTPITVNGTTVTGGYYAMVTVNLKSGSAYTPTILSDKTYYGTLLLRDGATIPNGYLTKTGTSSKYTDNVLSEDKFKALVKMGCLFIPAAGYHTGSAWDDLKSSRHNGRYWTRNFWKSGYVYQLTFKDDGTMNTKTTGSSTTNYYLVTKLVKPL